MTNEVTQALVHFRFDSGSSHMVDLISKDGDYSIKLFSKEYELSQEDYDLLKSCCLANVHTNDFVNLFWNNSYDDFHAKFFNPENLINA